MDAYNNVFNLYVILYARVFDMIHYTGRSYRRRHFFFLGITFYFILFKFDRILNASKKLETLASYVIDKKPDVLIYCLT